MVPQLQSRRSLWLAAVAVAVCGLLAPTARATDLKSAPTSLKVVSANAAFYVGALRNKEQLDLFLKSKAYAAIMEMPSVKQGLKHIKDEYEKKDSPLSFVRAFLETDENKQLFELLADSV